MEERTAKTNDGVVSYADDHGKDGDVNEAVFTDGTGEEAQGESAERTEGKTVQSKEQNSANARRRREAEQKKLIEKTRQEAIIEALGGTNPFTNEKMVDSADVDEYLLMKRISDEGGDPVEDYSKYRKRADKDTASKAAAETERQENAKKELAEFNEKYPEVKSEELFNDEDFMEFADGKFGAKTLSEIYESYKNFVAKHSTEADKKAARIMANAKATPGALATANTSTEQFFTREQVSKMSHDEVQRHYETIRKSMSKWK